MASYVTSTINFIDYDWSVILIAHAQWVRHDNVLDVAFRLMTNKQLCDEARDYI